MQYSCVLSSFSIQGEGIAFTLPVFCCPVAASFLCLFLVMSWVGLWSVIVAFPGHIHLLFIV